MPKSSATATGTRTGLRRKRSEVQPPAATDTQSPPNKRQRGRVTQNTGASAKGVTKPSGDTDNADDEASEHEEVTYAVAEEFPPVAVKLMNAIKRATNIPCIGYCPTQLDRQAEHMMFYGPEGLSKDNVDMNLKLTEKEKAREAHNAVIIAKLSDIYSKHVHDKASGYLDKPFQLKITRAKCTFNDVITPPPRVSKTTDDPYFEESEEKAIEARLKKWYSNAAVSGYGDVREQVTKVDKKVRNAREIPAEQFSVEPELLERIAALWDEKFYPNRGIRVEPYKIHLYGPGGHFDVHRDTPQKDLVGTFLLGLGDTTSGGGLNVDGTDMPAHGGHWCAFYPDVPHRVDEVWDGYRAVIAFKIFRTAGSGVETATTARVRQEATELMSQMHAPFGIMLERKYCLGTTELSGFDALLLQSALALPDVDVRHLPVVLTSTAEFGSHDEYDRDNDFAMECSTKVVPFTRGHIEALFNADRWTSVKHTECGSPWLEKVKNVAFFCLELPRALYVCSEEEQETCNYTGNEAQAWREDSVYLSYALLVLPQTRGTKRTVKGKGKGK